MVRRWPIETESLLSFRRAASLHTSDVALAKMQFQTSTLSSLDGSSDPCQTIDLTAGAN
jgi:hypothetical protein